MRTLLLWMTIFIITPNLFSQSIYWTPFTMMIADGLYRPGVLPILRPLSWI